MDWDLGLTGMLYLAAMSIGFGVVTHLLAGRAAPRWLWAVMTGVSFVVGLFISEVMFGWATEEDLQPNIDGLSRDEVLLLGLVPVAAAVLITRLVERRRRSPHHGSHGVTP